MWNTREQIQPYVYLQCKITLSKAYIHLLKVRGGRMVPFMLLQKCIQYVWNTDMYFLQLEKSLGITHQTWQKLGFCSCLGAGFCSLPLVPLGFPGLGSSLGDPAQMTRADTSRMKCSLVLQVSSLISSDFVTWVWCSRFHLQYVLIL